MKTTARRRWVPRIHVPNMTLVIVRADIPWARSRDRFRIAWRKRLGRGPVQRPGFFKWVMEAFHAAPRKLKRARKCLRVRQRLWRRRMSRPG